MVLILLPFCFSFSFEMAKIIRARCSRSRKMKTWILDCNRIIERTEHLSSLTSADCICIDDRMNLNVLLSVRSENALFNIGHIPIAAKKIANISNALSNLNDVTTAKKINECNDQFI